MKKIYILALIAASTLSVAAQSLDISFKEGKQSPTWMNNFSTKEIEKISHENNVVTITMKSGPVFNFGTDSIEKMVNIPAEDLSMYKNGDLLKITDQKDWDNDTLFVNDICQVAAKYLAYFKNADFNLIARLKQSRETPYQLHYHVYKFEYASTDIDGQKIRMSGQVVYPYSVNDGELPALKLSTVFLDNHYTSLREDQAPTRTFSNMLMTGIVGNGYLSVQPDYLGLGTTNNRTELFIHQEVMSRNCIDCVLAAMQLKDQVNNDDKYVDIPLAADAQMLNEGASQGASVAVGVHRYIENNLTAEEVAALPTLKETRVCSGCYDPYLSIEKYAKWDSLNFCVTVPLLLEGTVLANPDLMVDSDGNNITADRFFSEKFLTTRYPQYGNMTILEMIHSKQFDGWVPCYPMWTTFGNFQTNKAQFSAFMNPELFVNDTTINASHPLVVTLKTAFERSNNTHGWCPKAKLSLWHGPHDNFVPYENSVQLLNNIKAENPDANITLNNVNDEGISNPHSISSAMWCLAELMGMDVNTLLAMMRSLM